MFKWLTGKESGKKDEKPSPDTPPSSPPSTNDASPKSGSGFSKLKAALSSTGQTLFGGLFGGATDGQEGQPLTEDRIDEIEEALIRADVGVATATAISDKLRKQKGSIRGDEGLMAFLRSEFTAILSPYADANRLTFAPAGTLTVVLVVGVNGAGKTTFIGKLAHKLIGEGKQVVIGAGDTFRAAAEDQLAVWAQRAGATLVRKDGADPASVIFDAITQAKESGADVVILDTAGRLQNKVNLMEELRKVKAVIDKAKPEGATLESLLVLDATTGQNALQQAKVFQEAVSLSGVILTKLDGSAKGGVVLAVAQEYQLPVKMIGIGEGIEDLRDFNATDFINALFER